MGWSMNDLRNENRTLAAVPPPGPKTGEKVTASPPAAWSDSEKKTASLAKASRERSRVAAAAARTAAEQPLPAGIGVETEDPFSFRISRDLRATPLTTGSAEVDKPVEVAEVADVSQAKSAKARSNGPDSRPSRRRDADDGLDGAVDDDKFPWHHHFSDDEPVELKAKSPLLSRAFRSSVG